MIRTLADIRTIFIQASDAELGHDVAEEVRRQMGSLYRVVSSAAEADAILRVTLQAQQGGGLSNVGRVLSMKNRSEVQAEVVDARSARMLWRQGAGDKQPIVGVFHGDALKRLAERIVKELRQSVH